MIYTNEVKSWTFLCMNAAFFASFSGGLVLKPAIAPEEVAAIEQQMLFFYSEELLTTGLFEDFDAALKAAQTEWRQERESHSTGELHYLCLFSEEANASFGHLVYSIFGQAAYLKTIYLDPPHRGYGLGKKILKRWEAELSRKGIQTIKLHVFAHNQTAFFLYQKLGYSVISTYGQRGRLIGYHMQKTCD